MIRRDLLNSQNIMLERVADERNVSEKIDFVINLCQDSNVYISLTENVKHFLSR